MQFNRLKRREFITLLGGAAAVWPLPLSAQQPGKVARIGFLGAQSAYSYASQLAGFRLGLISAFTGSKRNRRG
jgi:putative ABC transport system substrate-binding protein